jgi:hypothetical protein
MKRVFGLAGAAVALSAGALAAELVIPQTVKLPDLKPLVAPCSDPAADRFLEIDISQRPPAGATRVQRVSGWVTPDGMFHWPFVMRVRNIGDQPFFGKAGEQAVTITEDDITGGKKGRVVATVPFQNIPAHSGVAARFMFSAPADNVANGKFRRLYTLSIQYNKKSEQLINGKNGDCDLQNNTFAVEFDGSRKGWIFAK